VTHGQCDVRPTVTFQANGRYQFILLGKQRHIVCEQLAQSCYVKLSGRDSSRTRDISVASPTHTPPRKEVGINQMTAAVCLSVRSSVACLNSRTEMLQCRKPKIGRMKAHHITTLMWCVMTGVG